MIKMRSGVFETNSSSSHSIVIKKGGGETPDIIDPGWYVYDNGTLYLHECDLEFGRSPFDVLCNWYHKLCYAIASYGADCFEEIEELIYAHVAGVKRIELPTTWDDNDERVPNYGWVDHQSDGLLQNFLANNDVLLKDFIFNDKYIVIIDGDEYQILDKMNECGLLNSDNIEKRYDA